MVTEPQQNCYFQFSCTAINEPIASGVNHLNTSTKPSMVPGERSGVRFPRTQWVVAISGATPTQAIREHGQVEHQTPKIPLHQGMGRLFQRHNTNL